MANMRAKGSRLEYAVRDVFLAHGIKAKRIPFSGSLGGDLCGDVHAVIGDASRQIECKKRAGGWSTIYAWLEKNYGLVLCADRKEPLIVLRLEDFAKLVR